MPLIIPKTLPAYDALYKENVFVMHRERALAQHIRPLEILILNLMPTKITTETQIARLLANTPLQVHMTLLQTASHAATHVSAAHLESFYKNFDEVKNNRYDGMIITGAPVETMDFEQVDYWQELCEIMDFSETNVYSTLHVCWGAQAGLYYHYGIRKELLPLLAERYNAEIVPALARTALLLGEDADFLTQTADAAYARLVTSAEDGLHIALKPLLAEHIAVRLRVLRRAYFELGGSELSFERSRALAALCERRSGGRLIQLPGGITATIKNKQIIFTRLS